MIATSRFNTFARIGTLESAKEGFEAWKPSTREVMKASGEEWNEKVSDKPRIVLGEP